MTSLQNILNQLDKVDWDFAGYNPNGRGLGIHNIHWYPAPFPSAVAGTLIDILGSDSHSFLDPFCGSSVAPLEAWFRGKKSFGIDNNCFAINLAEAKIQFVSDGSTEISKEIFNSFSEFRKKNITSWLKRTPEEICKRAEINLEVIKWFVPSILVEIAIVKQWILRTGGLTEQWQNALKVTLSSLLHGQFSIARHYHYTYVVDNSKVKNEARTHVDVSEVFKNKFLDNMIQGQLVRERLLRINPNFSNDPRPRFLKGLAQELGKYIAEEVGLVVTSPPYFGMNDYVRSQYLSWLIFDWNGYKEDLETESGSRRRRNSKTFYDLYFNDMHKTFTEVHKILRKGGFLGLVVGSSTAKLARELNPLSQLLFHLENIGFKCIWKGQRRVRFRKINNTPFRDEVIWVFQK